MIATAATITIIARNGEELSYPARVDGHYLFTITPAGRFVCACAKAWAGVGADEALALHMGAE